MILSGCPSDSVPGIPGVGWGTARSYVRGETVRETVRYAIESPEGQRIQARNRRLLALPLAGCPRPSPPMRE
jgi:5'-3' exonuclease